MRYLYPGSFSPPTFGHVAIVEQASKVFESITVVCASNPDKDNLFSPDGADYLFRTYALPSNVKVMTSKELKGIDMKQVTLIRGIRHGMDIEYERGIQRLNSGRFGIDKFVYFLCDKSQIDISSTKARQLCNDVKLQHLSDYISPLVISRMLEKRLDICNLFMVVGKPGAGKSTFLKELVTTRPYSIHINTDDFNHRLMPLLKQTFGEEDIVEIALRDEGRFKEVIAKPWMEMLETALRDLPPKCNAFVEIPYGLQPDKSMFRFIGGKIIYVGTGDENTNRQRLKDKEHQNRIAFMDRIPGHKESLKIAKDNKLQIISIDTSGSMEEMKEQASQLSWSL